jgi:hypothetical protein
MAVLLIGLRGLEAIPLPLGLGIARGALRLIGGVLGLAVGYKVGGMIVVMGWLVHDEQLGAWVPLRLFWTVIGILLALLSLNLVWPSRCRAACQAGLVELLAGLAEDLEREAGLASGGARALAEAEAAHRERQAALQRLRRQLPALASELGNQPSRHPAFRLVDTLDEAASRLLGASRDLSTLALGRDPELKRLQEGEAALLQALAARLRLWCRSLEQTRAALPQAPATPLQPPPLWLTLEAHFSHPDLNRLPPRRLEQVAARLTLCRQALEAIEAAERSWAALSPGPLAPGAPGRASDRAAERLPAAG